MTTPDPAAMPDAPTPEAPQVAHAPAWTLALVIVAFLIRLLPPWLAVFGEDHVSFLESDAWYHMRLVDALLHDFPWRIWHDAYLVHPGGEPVNAGPMFDWLVALPAWILGLGAPTARLTDVVGAVVPPVIGALTVVPVVGLGARLFSMRAGLWAGLLFAAMPGQTLQRSLLGFTDHHCAETLFSTTALLFLVRGLVDSTHRRRDAFLAGGALGFYLLTWGGGVFIVVLVVAWAILAMAARIWRSAGLDDITTVVTPMLGVAGVMVLPWARTRPHFAYQLGAIAGGLLVLVALRAAAAQASRRGWSRGRLLAALGGAALLAIGVAALAMGDSLGSLRGDVARVSPFRTDTVVTEARPLLASPRLMKPVPLWREFGIGTVLAALGAGVLAGAASPATGAARGLFALWTVVALGATVGQVRFTYYLGVNVALLSGVALERLLATTARRPSLRLAGAAIAVAAIVGPGAPELLAMRSSVAWPDRNWVDALTWMQGNTPEPFGDPAAYLASHVDRPSAYGVLAWWDSGYWITRIARRVPVTNPRQTAMQDVARFLVATDVAEARHVLDRLGARYVIVDAQLQVRLPGERRLPGFFSAIERTAGGDGTPRCESFVDRRNGMRTDLWCAPEYHQAMAMRLYLHGARAVTDVTPVRVVRFRRRRGAREVQHSWDFPDLATARSFAAAQDDPTTIRVVCPDLLRSCVPLPALPEFVSRYRSLGTEGAALNGPALVHVFEYRPDIAPSVPANAPTTRH
ncbi:hypothetical protein TBR22_A47400 [Luteitalea sp. TBR-22]|uniref:STT3 domain-containing protein n=1 Tax=Luteitalea sp. TBR-22 TaxID=2802971 RepID=UPI001AF2CA2F|nr:STT3 domain-containing protein [Luteitalea sp. TBR-22]BCS35509.1 hypothetical protein TBR22_A47400 [Luteitalea sp. TBR-22]